MAVYKATYCYPFLGNCDLRVAPGKTQWITCKVDSSNKKVTGYRISIYDDNNNLIFPYYDEADKEELYQQRDWNVSPVSELLYADKLTRNDKGALVIIAGDGMTEIKLPSQEYLTNSGVNGSYLNLPFFQNDAQKIRESANAIYYVPKIFADYLVKPVELGSSDFYTPENSYYWIRHSDGKYYYNSRENYLTAVNEAAGLFTSKLNGDSKVRPGVSVLLYLSKDPSLDSGLLENAVVVGHLEYDNTWRISPDYSTRKEDISMGAQELILPGICLITRGSYHNSVYEVTNVGMSNYSGPFWQDLAGHPIKFSIGKSYKWEIVLYQGDGRIKTRTDSRMKLIDYLEINTKEWYDMVLQTGKILGSCPTRIQLAKYNEDSNSYLLPKNKDGSSVVLYQTYAQLINEYGNDSGARFYVNTYNSTLGHVYPLESESGVISVNNAKEIEFYQHSNNPEAILDTDMVEFAAVKDHVYNKNEGGMDDVAGNVELCGVQNIDDVIGEEGSYVLLMYQKDPAQNGVYKMVSDSDNTISLKTSVTSTTSDGKITINLITKTYKRDSTQDIYDDRGIPTRFAWTHQITEEEQKAGQSFTLTYYSTKRYLVKDISKVYPLGGGDGTVLSSVKMTVWARAGGYTSWSDFIGKIIYVRSGTVNGQKNFSSTATAGGTLMKKAYGDATGGSSPLYFVSERPVILFPQLLNNDYNIKAFGILGSSGVPNEVDGILLADGDYYIDASSGKIYKYLSAGSALAKDFNEIKDLEYYYIAQGKTSGMAVCKLDGTVSPSQIQENSQDLYRAEVLKNTANRTFVGQYLNLDTNMILKFDNNVINLEDETGSVDYLRIKKIDRTIWCVEHEKLISPLRSYSSNQVEPYSYKICTFYKKSDENSFYFKETPYLMINDGLNDDYTRDDDMSILAAYPTNSDGTLSTTAAPYVLSRNGIFIGTAEQAFEKVSYIDNIQSTEEIKKTEEKFFFPSPEGVDAETNPLGLRWSDGSPYVFSFSKKKVQDKGKIRILLSTLTEIYGKIGRLPLGAGEDGLKKLSMPDSMITAAVSKYTETIAKENYLIYNYSPLSESGYKLSLNGLYKQGNGGSWESYRWVLEKVKFDSSLTDSEISSMVRQGDMSLEGHVADSIVIKDTGTKYDKKINVEFYGLLDSLGSSVIGGQTIGIGGKSLSSNIYLITLYVTDEGGIDLEEKRFVEYKSPASKSCNYCIKAFKVEPACGNECAKLIIKPGFKDNQQSEYQNGDTNFLKEFSIFRREYKKLYRFNQGEKEERVLVGNKWEPVALNVEARSNDSEIDLLDFNIKSNYSYQYVIFPGPYSEQAKRIPYIYANTGTSDQGDSEYDPIHYWRPYYSSLSKPIRLNMQYWSIVNLLPVSRNSQPDLGVDTYIADPENIWLFKYQVESGSLMQNISKNEYNTLGQYSRIGVGRKNYLSGSVSCYLGREIIPLSKNGYVERMPLSRERPLSTNEKAYMTDRWREFVATGTPKLLRNTKGQSWIVQVMDGSTTTNESVAAKPDAINFSWKQVASTENTIIYADATQVPSAEGCLGEWQEDLNYE